MRAHFGLPSVEAEDKEGKPPISVKFEIPYFTTSGIQVRPSRGLGWGWLSARGRALWHVGSVPRAQGGSVPLGPRPWQGATCGHAAAIASQALHPPSPGPSESARAAEGRGGPRSGPASCQERAAGRTASSPRAQTLTPWPPWPVLPLRTASPPAGGGRGPWGEATPVLELWCLSQVRYLKIIEKSGYQALPWVRYITQNGGERALPEQGGAGVTRQPRDGSWALSAGPRMDASLLSPRLPAPDPVRGHHSQQPRPCPTLGFLVEAPGDAPAQPTG